ncbi:MATE family efflux transporter [Paenibacillus beijingensis]|uniref:Multidrug transporter MatE n=1 Tax=Paenibacillus beijingensis TaxID=1126833 RepID=A0A0D5NS23_9BACL|nr:MATE family efflux transporter [Paenibacillus beijingensis]AJY77688.1 multidrug transporter MatE [Paenibacillus beijingensis]
MDKKYNLWVLSWPIFIELLLQFLLGTVDTLMVSRVSDDAVAVVGFANQLFAALTTLFTIVASGAGILIAQKLGARKEEDARTISVIAVKATFGIGLLLSIVLMAMPRTIALALQMPESLLPLADTYISIVGGGMLLTALMTTLSTVIRNTGNTKAPMVTAIGMNVVHIVLNYGFIYGAFGLPQWGLTGVALSTLVSRLLATLLLFYMFIYAFERKMWLPDLKLWHRGLFREVMNIGWPLGVNMASWVFSQLVIYVFLNMLGPKELAARTYMNSLESFCFLLGFSLALAGQIKAAYLYGEGRMREVSQTAFRMMLAGQIVVIVNALIIFIFGRQLLGFFTDDPEIIALGASLLGLNLLLQPGKMLNMGLGDTLNAVGDTRFVMKISLFSMWIVSVGISYVLGVELGWGLIGIYVCMIADEYLRGALCLWRWRSKKWARGVNPGPAAPGTGAAAEA